MAEKPTLETFQGWGDLSPLQIQAAVLTARGFQVGQVAERCEVTAWTVSRWRQKPAFRALVNTYVRDATLSLQSQCLVGQQLAVRRLIDIVTDPGNDPGHVIAASKLLLSVPAPDLPEEHQCDPQILEQDQKWADYSSAALGDLVASFPLPSQP